MKAPVVKAMKSSNSGRTAETRYGYFVELFGNRWVFDFFSQVPGNPATSGKESGQYPGVTKWKHWLIYPWFKGAKMEALPKMKILHPEVMSITGRFSWVLSSYITPKVLKNILIDLHYGLLYPWVRGDHGNVNRQCFDWTERWWRMFSMVDGVFWLKLPISVLIKRSEDYTSSFLGTQFQSRWNRVILSASTLRVQAVYQETGRCFGLGALVGLSWIGSIERMKLGRMGGMVWAVNKCWIWKHYSIHSSDPEGEGLVGLWVRWRDEMQKKPRCGGNLT